MRISTQALGTLPASRHQQVLPFGTKSGATLTGQSSAGRSLRLSLVPVLNEFSDTFRC